MEAELMNSLMSEESLEGLSPELFAEVKIECLVQESSPSHVKRKREDNASIGISKRTCSPPKLDFATIKTEAHGKTSFLLDNVAVPEVCSLYDTVIINWNLSGLAVNLSSALFVQNTTEPQPSSHNGIWLQPSCGGHPISNLLLLIELFEKETKSVRMERIDRVQFCKKCVQTAKKAEIIELRDQKIIGNNGHFQAQITINEQCAHRSSNGYGSPKAIFFFRMALYETVKGQPKRELLQSQSNLIKVVAYGKGASTSKKIIKEPRVTAPVAKVGSSKNASGKATLIKMLVDKIKSQDTKIELQASRIDQLETKMVQLDTLLNAFLELNNQTAVVAEPQISDLDTLSFFDDAIDDEALQSLSQELLESQSNTQTELA